MIRSSSSSGFVLPLAFPGACNREKDSQHGKSNRLLDSFHRAQPTCMKTWTRTSEGDGRLCKGLVVGCEDGSLYVFYHRGLSQSTIAIEPPSTEAIQSPYPKATTRDPRNSFQRSRSTSPSAASAPLLVSPRSRVVSGVSTEQVEAPKNYVDFDDEPDKLKDMLKGKLPSAKTISDVASEGTASVKSATPPVPPIVEPTPTKRKELSKVLLNLTSPSSSKPFSAPVSPRDQVSPDSDLSDELELLYHIIPPTNGAGNAVKSISILADLLICVALQESGSVCSSGSHLCQLKMHSSSFLYLFCLTDGHCLTSVQVKDGLSREQLAPKDRDVLYETYTWQNLQVTITQQVHHARLCSPRF